MAITAGNFAIQRSDDGINPFPIVLEKVGSFPSMFESLTGRIFVFYNIEIATVFYVKMRFSDDNGTTWTANGDEVTVASTVLEGQTGCKELPSSRLMVFYWKDVAGTSTQHYNYSDDYGVTWPNETVIAES